jgi:hypothetical protein
MRKIVRFDRLGYSPAIIGFALAGILCYIATLVEAIDSDRPDLPWVP